MVFMPRQFKLEARRDIRRDMAEIVAGIDASGLSGLHVSLGYISRCVFWTISRRFISQMHEALKPMVEAWAGGVELETTDLYGIRIYQATDGYSPRYSPRLTTDLYGLHYSCLVRRMARRCYRTLIECQHTRSLSLLTSTREA